MTTYLRLILCAVWSLSAQAADLSLEVPSLHPNGAWDQEQVYDGLGCHGHNRSPALEWRNAPATTRGFAVTVFDPDAPGAGWWLWLVYNLPAATHGLAEGVGDSLGRGLPERAVQTLNDFGTLGFGGPCPPAGDRAHRYLITVHALDVPVLDTPPNAAASAIEHAIRAHSLAHATVQARYGR